MGCAYFTHIRLYSSQRKYIKMKLHRSWFFFGLTAWALFLGFIYLCCLVTTHFAKAEVLWEKENHMHCDPRGCTDLQNGMRHDYSGTYIGWIKN